MGQGGHQKDIKRTSLKQTKNKSTDDDVVTSQHYRHVNNRKVGTHSTR